MKWQLPPLNALRSFEAAARLGSFAAAADELGVTSGAVSRQISKLEDYLACNLFKCGSRDVKLTLAGETYLEMASTVFHKIDQETAVMRKSMNRNTLTIWSSMTVSMRWLVPSLVDFHATTKGMEVALTTSIRPLAGNAREFDFAIRLGDGIWPGYETDFLFTSDLIPVCSPELAGSFPTGTPQDLIGQTLLHSHLQLGNWQAYWSAAGLGDLTGSKGVHFEISTLAYQAAAEGMGVALGQRRLVAADLAAGKLIAPVNFSVPAHGGFYLIYSAETLRRKPAMAFRKWIIERARSGK